MTNNSKSKGNPKNYQHEHYESYYLMLPDGSSVPTTRRECFAPPENLSDCPYKQRWYYSPDQQMAIRLPRNELGDRMGKANAADLRAQMDWDQRLRKAGVDSLDESLSKESDTDEDGYTRYSILPATDGDILSDLLAEEALTIILDAVSSVAPELCDLCLALLAKEKICDIARRCGVTEGAIRKRVKKLERIWDEHSGLKKYFEEF